MKKAQKSPSSMSYSRQLNAKQIERNKSINILLKGEHGKSIIVIIPALNTLRSFDKPVEIPVKSAVNSAVNSTVDSSVTPTFKYIINRQNKIPLPSYRTFSVNSPINLSFINVKSPANSQVNLINNSPIQIPEIKHETPVKSLMRYKTPAKKSSSEEESFYELNQQSTSQSDGSLQELPVLPYEPHNSPIYIMFHEKPPSECKVITLFNMFIAPDDKFVGVDVNKEHKFVDCEKLFELLMILLTMLFNWGDNPDFMKYKKHISDPAFEILEKYYNEDYYKNDYDEIPAVKMEPVNELAIADTKRKRKPKVYSDDYYCENINQIKIKKSKLENSQSLKIRTNSLNQNIMKKEIILKPKKIMTQKFEEEMASSDEISLQPNGTKIKAELFKTIKWNSPTTATRKLLSIIFSNETLATHSLTGKPSPAFIGRERPLKEQLNPNIIADVIATVSSHTKGTIRVIRNAITTKCADTSKMVRGKTQNKNCNIQKEKIV